MSIVIVGAGPNLGLAIARRFGREGFSVGLISRTQSKLDDLAAQLEGEGITAAGAAADIRDAKALRAAIEALAGRLGEVEVLEYSPLPASEFMKPLLETTVEDVRGPLEFSILGAVAATQAVLGPMQAAGRGTLLFTTGGAAINPNPARTGGRDLLRRRDRLRPDAPRRTSESGHPCRAYRDRRQHRARRRPPTRRRRRRPLEPPRRAPRISGSARHQPVVRLVDHFDRDRVARACGGEHGLGVDARPRWSACVVSARSGGARALS
jgi:NAD(P)-dependent dehydrogenase (short-subunit alcohol dehydrogenase family)